MTRTKLNEQTQENLSSTTRCFGSIVRMCGIYQMWFQQILLDRNPYGHASRSAIALVGGILCGIVSVAVDVDHIICAVLQGVPFDVTTRQYGCRLWHQYLLCAGTYIGCFAGALWIGLCVLLMGQTIRAIIRASYTVKS